ncbi:hypothetical protein WAE56_11510 [Iodobacter sp. LRB]|uniref:hypothetical protein n=1 Tax=unclassified Iodobacter TaxID=235634 RepID=UPI001C55724F|nr:hypothetical protein [Iodobacter sp. BJB302]
MNDLEAMRKQYHLRSSEQGLKAWDVHRLIKLSVKFAEISVPLEQIAELDQSYWFDEGGAAPTCRAISEHAKLINETDLRFPIILSQNGRVMDGMHRVAKALMLGMAEIKAVQFSQDPEPDFIGIDADDLPY